MANWFLQGCNYIYELGYRFDLRVPAYVDIKLFPDDPNGAPNSHATCSHPNNTACFSSFTSDGLQNSCEPLFPGSAGGFSDPPIGVLNGRQIGIGLVRPTMFQRGVNPGPGVYPLFRKPVRSYHAGMWGGAYGLPVGWYLFYRVHPRSIQVNPIVQINPLFIYDFTYVRTLDNRTFATNFYFKDGLNPNAIWSFGGTTGAGSSNVFRTWGPSNGLYKWDLCCTNSYIQNNNTRFVFDNVCGVCV